MNLMRFFDDWVQRPWVWGESDCCQFAGAYIEFVTGKNPAKAFHYSTETEAGKIIAEHGDLEGLLTRFLGKPVSHGEHGMLALVDRPELVGVVYRHRIVARTPGDINDIPLRRARRFWCPN